MVVKFSKGDILYNRKEKLFLEVMNNAGFDGGLFEGIYSLRNLKTNKTYMLNKDIVEKHCTLCRNVDKKTMKVLYGRSQKG